MAKTKQEQLIAQFQGVTSETDQRDMFAFTKNRVSLLINAARTVAANAKTKRPPVKEDPLAQAAENSRSEKVKSLRNVLANVALAGGDNEDDFTELQLMQNAFNGLLQTATGITLRDLMLKNTRFSDCVLYQLFQVGRSFTELPQRARYNLHVLTNPIGAYLDRREILIKRIEEKKNFANFIQKDEHLLHRLQATLTLALHPTTATPTLELKAAQIPSSLTVFAHLWDLHVTELHRYYPQRAGPLPLTVGLMELLLVTTDANHTATLCGLSTAQRAKLMKANRLAPLAIALNTARMCSDRIRPDDE